MITDIINVAMVPVSIVVGSLLGGGAAHLILRKRPFTIARSEDLWPGRDVR